MQRDPSSFHGKVSPTGYGVGGNIHNTPFGGHYTYGAPIAPPFGGAALAATNYDFLYSPLNGLEFQPTEICPQNFIIFDQTENKSRVMFHPTLAPKLNYPYDFNDCAENAHEGGSAPEKNDETRDGISFLKENTADIDALLSSDEDDEEDDTVSTGRSPADLRRNSPYSSASEDEEWNSSSSQQSFSSGASSSSGSARKRARMRKMVKALRGIIPGGDSMVTPAVLDEAVKYLKSLKFKAKKLGIRNFKTY